MSTSDSNCEDGATKSNNDGVCEMVGKLQKLSTADVSICANCGKEGASNTCNKCKMVKYCNAICKKVHKKKHKKDCEEHIRLVAEKRDEELFKQPPPREDCPICFLLVPLRSTGYKYYACCGEIICSGCSYAPVYDNQGNKVANKKCPFCRTPYLKSTDDHGVTNEEALERLKKRVEKDDPMAIYTLGWYYSQGLKGFPQDYKKAVELWHRAGELGSSAAYCSIGCAYQFGQGVEIDTKKAQHYYELAAIMGNVMARYNLGIMEKSNGKVDRALKHYMIATESGDAESLEEIQELYTDGHATKEEYMKALQSYQAYLGEIKSSQRDKAAAAYEKYRYY